MSYNLFLCILIKGIFYIYFLCYRELRERAIKSKHFREDIERLKSDQEAWKVEQERLDQEENSRIIRFMHDREEKLKQIKESYITKRKAETERQNEMCAQLNQLEVSIFLYFLFKV